MQSFIQIGDVVEFTAPAGGVTVDVPALIGGWFVVPAVSVTVGLRFNGAINGVFKLAKATGEAWAEGQGLYWDATNLRFSIDATVGLPVASVVVAALSADTTGIVRLNGVSLAGRVLTIRKRLAVASVNAGATLLPALAGLKYRLVTASVIAVGGAATSVTTVDILATLAAGSRKLVAFAQASLTQSTKLTDGGAGAAILADGASYTANDVNTGITANITGSAITVATNIDFLVTYQLEA